MTMNPLPPQAYTKETLLKAYQWMQAQPPAIREMAQTPDILVSLFLKASRDGDQSLDRPSIQNFKTELKNLAGMMGELDPPKPSHQPQRAAQPPSGASANGGQHYQQHAAAQHSQNSAAQTFAQFTAAQQAPPPGWDQFQAEPTKVPQMSGSTISTPAMSHAASTNSAASGLGLDSKSLEMLKEIRHDYNLSSDAEALRMLIKVGFSKAKSFLKNP
jgi:hypothetical protein